MKPFHREKEILNSLFTANRGQMRDKNNVELNIIILHTKPGRGPGLKQISEQHTRKLF